MNVANRKIQLGDVVRRGTRQYKISRIEPNYCYVQISIDGVDNEGSFGTLTDEGLPLGWGEHWELVDSEAPPDTVRNKQITNDVSDWRAWAHNRPGECPCGIRKEVCEYHK